MIGELVKSAARSSLTKPTHGMMDTVSCRFRVLPQHIDFNMHINNAKYLEFLERARWDHSVKTGAFKHLLAKRFNFIVAGIDIGYIRELKLFQSFDIETTVHGWDEKYFYIEQRCVVDGRIHSYALVKAVYMLNGKPASPEQVWQALPEAMPTNTLPEHMHLWKELANAKREYSQKAAA